MRDDLARRHRARRPARERNYTEGAAVIAAVLHLDVGARARSEALDEMSGGLAHAHDVVDLHPLRAGGRKPGECFRPHLLGVADDVIDFAQCRKSFRLDLCGAAGDDDTRRGVLAAQLANGFRCLTHRLGRDGARVDDDRVVEPGSLCVLAHDVGLISIEPAAERYDAGIGHADQETSAAAMGRHEGEPLRAWGA